MNAFLQNLLLSTTLWNTLIIFHTLLGNYKKMLKNDVNITQYFFLSREKLPQQEFLKLYPE